MDCIVFLLLAIVAACAGSDNNDFLKKRQKGITLPGVNDNDDDNDNDSAYELNEEKTIYRKKRTLWFSNYKTVYKACQRFTKFKHYCNDCICNAEGRSAVCSTRYCFGDSWTESGRPITFEFVQTGNRCQRGQKFSRPEGECTCILPTMYRCEILPTDPVIRTTPKPDSEESTSTEQSTESSPEAGLHGLSNSIEATSRHSNPILNRPRNQAPGSEESTSTEQSTETPGSEESVTESETDREWNYVLNYKNQKPDSDESVTESEISGDGELNDSNYDYDLEPIDP